MTQHTYSIISQTTEDRFDEVENDLRRDWDESHRGSGASSAGGTWDRVRDSVRRAWHKAERAMPGDADRDGR